MCCDLRARNLDAAISPFVRSSHDVLVNNSGRIVTVQVKATNGFKKDTIMYAFNLGNTNFGESDVTAFVVMDINKIAYVDSKDIKRGKSNIIYFSPEKFWAIGDAALKNFFG